MRIDLSGKTALITGSTAGIGFAIAQGLAAAGASVVINGRTEARVSDAVQRLREVNPDATINGVAADLSKADGCAALLRQVPATDILVNNLGIFKAQDFFDTPDEEWQRFFEVNVLSGVRVSRAYVPHMLEKNWGRVVFLSSESGINIPEDMIHYGFTKSANLSVSRGLAKRLAGTGVTVNAVLPGPTLSDGVMDLLRPGADKQGVPIEQAGNAFVKAKRPTSIIQRVATPDEVANMVVYVCSPQASATTGAALRVEGGIVDTLT
ncbi:NAD(P)-dependent dehydrogenase, short-chain alcohol dehydrogenase family [Halopseudomonas xinjiangensis]|uniref:NAD(P)-dependent dehydrogenase, short-chain alcohol dehydrogenase family n=1 Tax=Halopseudomonas xinjiangensis TaxID=487184 RepID=A0A1H1R8S7_9GAMM|nr:SDR family oxidoreductase [Halopseudomonas xinjiangensis]SDS32214.1 NAD(P)-dependent dehydrogenase, short-chain alcohol dehydrogenase family [Halopseudomonas xinjiangensis]